MLYKIVHWANNKDLIDWLYQKKGKITMTINYTF